MVTSKASSTNMPPSNEAAISQVQQHPSQALAKAGYELLNAEALSDFVAQHSELIDILVQAYTPLTAFFDGAKLQLEYRQDPEIPDWEMVWIAVVVEIPDSQAEAEAMFEHATQRLDAFDQFCWLEVPSEIRQLLGVDLKFHALPMAGLLDAGRAATTRAAQTLQR